MCLLSCPASVDKLPSVAKRIWPSSAGLALANHVKEAAEWVRFNRHWREHLIFFPPRMYTLKQGRKEVAEKELWNGKEYLRTTDLSPACILEHSFVLLAWTVLMESVIDAHCKSGQVWGGEWGAILYPRSTNQSSPWLILPLRVSHRAPLAAKDFSWSLLLIPFPSLILWPLQAHHLN